jgi:hypothetical protein
MSNLWFATIVATLASTLVSTLVTHRLNRGLADRQVAATRDLEKLKSELQVANTKLLAQEGKVRDSEFTTLTKVWEQLQLAQGAVAVLMAPVQPITNVTELSDNFLAQALEQVGFNLDQRSAVMKANGPARQQVYTANLPWVFLERAETICREYNNYVAINVIFIPSNIAELCLTHATILKKSLNTFRLGLQLSDNALKSQANQECFPDADTTREKIALAIQKRLHPE